MILLCMVQKLETKITPNKTALKKMSKKMSTNKKYANGIFSNYATAKKEFEKAGVEMTKADHANLKKGMKLMEKGLKPIGKMNPMVSGSVSVTIST